MRTGHQPTGPIQYPTLGSAAREGAGPADAELPNYVSIAPYRIFEPRAFGPGFLGPQYAPLTVGAGNAAAAAQAADYAELGVDDLRMPGGVDADAGRRPPGAVAHAAREFPGPASHARRRWRTTRSTSGPSA